MPKKRKVSFYKLSLEQEIYNNSNKVDSKSLSNEQMENCFKRIYNDNMHNIDNTSKAISVRTLRRQVVVEVTKYEDHMVFAKIGQQNASNTVGLRDNKTLKTEDVPMTPNQQLELFTYCLIDFSTGIVSYIGINGAPRISVLKYLFKDFLEQYNIVAELDSILTNDILEQIVNKDIIGSILISVALPPDEILSETLNLNRDDFDKFRNVKRTTAQYKITATRNRNIFASSSHLSRVFTNIKEKFGDSLKKVSVNAKNANETMQPYDLLEYNFSKTVELNSEKADNLLNESDFYNALKRTYELSKFELQRYIKQ